MSVEKIDGLLAELVMAISGEEAIVDPDDALSLAEAILAKLPPVYEHAPKLFEASVCLLEYYSMFRCDDEVGDCERDDIKACREDIEAASVSRPQC